MNKLDMNILNNFKNKSYSTYRSTADNNNNYALIGNIKYIVEDTLNIYPIITTFKLTVSRDDIYDEAIYSLRVYLENGEVKVKIICIKFSTMIDFCVDKLEKDLNLYVSSNIVGSTITLYEIEPSGFVTWKNFNKFTMTNDAFKNKIIAKSNEIYYASSVTIDSETSGRTFSLKRIINNVYTKLVGFINSAGVAFIGKSNDNLANGEYITGMGFENNNIQIIMPSGGIIYPERNASYHIGSNDSKFRSIHLQDGVVISRTSAPTNPVNGMSFFYAIEKKWVTYYDGVWYTATGEEITL